MNDSVLIGLSTIELGFAAGIVLCALFYIHFFLSYAWNQKQLKLLDDEENLNLIGFTFWGALVSVFTLISLITPADSHGFVSSIVLLLLCVVTSKYYYFRSLRKTLKLFEFDRFYRYMLYVYVLFTLYFLYEAVVSGMSSIYDLNSPQVSLSVLRSRIIPYDLKSSVKLLFLPNYLFCLIAYVYLIYKSYRREEYLITFGVSFTMLSIFYTNSYHLFQFKYWAPLNVMADVFELFRLNIIQKQKIKSELNSTKNKLEILESEVNELEGKNLELRVFKHDVANKFTSAQLQVSKLSRVVKKENIESEKLTKSIDKAIEAQNMVRDFFLAKDEIKDISLKDFAQTIGDMQKVEFTLETDINPVIKFNIRDFTNIFINLVKNAKEANLDKDKVWVKLKFTQADSMYQFQLLDCGHFSDIKDPGKLFKTGYSTKNKESRGLGLYSVKSLVEKYHGVISLSEENSHTCFSFNLKIPESV